MGHSHKFCHINFVKLSNFEIDQLLNVTHCWNPISAIKLVQSLILILVIGTSLFQKFAVRFIASNGFNFCDHVTCLTS